MPRDLPPARHDLKRTDPDTLEGLAPEAERPWVWLVAAIRAAVAISYLGIRWFNGAPLSGIALVLVAAFALYGLISLGFWRVRQASAGLTGLVVDTIFLLSFRHMLADPSARLDAVFYVYLLWFAVTLHRFRDVCVIVATCGADLFFVGDAQREVLWRLVWPGGLLACLLAWQKKRMQIHLAQLVRIAEQCERQVREAREKERQRLAGDFHDGPMQGFINFKLRLEALRKILERDPAVAQEELQEFQARVDSQIQEMRTFLGELRSSRAERGALGDAIGRLARDFQKETGIEVILELEQAAEHRQAEVRTEVLQIVREALQNVKKHAGATRTIVKLSRSSLCLEVNIEDNGIGFPFCGSFNLEELDALRLGPASIKHRVRNLGGRMTLHSRPEYGSRIQVCVPL